MRLYLLTIGRLNYFLVVYAISYRKQRLNIRLSLKRSFLSWWQNLHQFSFRSSWRPRITWQDVYRANVFRLHDYALSSRTRGRNRTGRAMSRNFPDRRRKENKSGNKSCGMLDGHAPPPSESGHVARRGRCNVWTTLPLNRDHSHSLSEGSFKAHDPGMTFSWTVLARNLKAKFHYMGPTGPARTLLETRTDPTEFLGETRAAKKVRAGPVGPV